MRRSIGIAALVVAVCAPLTGPARDVPPASGTLDELLAVIRPQAGEMPWAALPWETNLPAARRKAAAEGKLILMWHAGGGQPLGFV